MSKKTDNLTPPSVGSQQRTGPSASSRSQAPSHRRAKRKRDEKAASVSGPPENLQTPGLLPHINARRSSRIKSQRTMEQQDSSSHVTHHVPEGGLVWQRHSRPSNQKSRLNSENPFHSTSVGSMEDGAGSKTGSSHSLVNNKRASGIPTSKSLSSGSNLTNYSMVSIFQHSDGPKSGSDHRRSMSPRPSSLTPSKSMKQPGRSPSPTIATNAASFPGGNKQQISDQGAKLPSFDSPPVHGIPSQGAATITWVDQSKGDDGHDSDSSGSGGILHAHSRRSPKRSKKHQRAEPLSGLKPPEQQQTRDGEHGSFNIGNMQNAKQPETPALGPIPGFSLANFQPISPGVVETHKLKEQFPPGFDYDPNLPMPLKYQLQAHDNFEEREHIKATLKAIEKKGALSHTVVHGVFVGPARSGKNSLMENLLGQIPPLKIPSTGVADAVIQVQVEKLTTVAATVDKGSIWSRIDDNDEVIRLISMHSDPKNVHYKQEDGVVHDFGTCARVRPFIHKKHISDAPLEILTKAIENKGLDALQKYFDTSWSLYLSNTGGQIEFQEILPLLVSGPCVFFYTFRLDRDLNEHYTIEYELQDGTKSQLYKSSLTTIEGIQQSLASIAAMGIFVYQGREKKNVQLRPKVFLVGTHRDLLPNNLAESIIAEKDRCLQQSTSQFVDIIEFASSSQMIFTVNNFSQDRSSFQKIRSAVEHAVERHEFEMVCPSHWLILSFALRRFEQETIGYEECFQVAKQCGIVDKDELSDALHFIHTKMGLIRYFPHEYIKDIVVVKPQLLYNKISELIVKTFTFDKAGKQSAEQFEKGIFSLDEFERICRRSSEGSMKAPQFAMLLENLRITAPLERDGGRVTKYFIPCVLAHAAKANNLEIQSLEIPPLVVTFKCGYCPKGLGGALISYIMANKHSLLEWSLLTDCVFRDQVTFKVGPLADKVIVKLLSTHLVIACVPNPKIQMRKGCHADDVCIEVRKVVEAGIKQVVADTDFIDSEVERSLTFLCPCDKCLNQYPAEMKYHNGEPFRLHCRKTEECPELPQGYEKWFTTKSQRQSATFKENGFTQEQVNTIFRFLTPYAARWRAIGTGLRFTQYELDNIENMPSLFFTAPTSMLHKMLSNWLQWAPGDSRGSIGSATVEALIFALVNARLAAAADDLNKALGST